MKPLPLILALASALTPDLPAYARPVGGGLLDSGLVGEYFDNDSLSGSPAFTRRDIRLDFDWGTQGRPGGGLVDSQLDALDSDTYSIRWTGRLMPRFSEDYVLSAEADSVRIWIKPSDAPDFPATPLIDHWEASENETYTPHSATIPLIAGKPYDVKIEYRERTGPARMRLLWSSPSTPREVVHSSAIVAEQPPGRAILLADAILAATNWAPVSRQKGDETPLAVCPDGWPTADFTFILRPIDQDLHLGDHLLSFRGTSNVELRGLENARFLSADGKEEFGSSASPGQGYDSTTNTTILRVRVAAPAPSLWPVFTQTDRDGPGQAFSPGSGVTNLRLLRPLSPGSTNHHDPNELFARDGLAALERFITYRWNDVNNDGDADWAKRPTLGSLRITRGEGGENHEYKILLSNHTGRDLWIQIPHAANDEYVTNLARLIKYGSDKDGRPYEKPTERPYHPPLNPNLRVYVEYSNEAPWNSAGQYPQGKWMRAQPEVWRQAWLKDPNSPDGRRFAILNYDSAFPTDKTVEGMAPAIRFFALRTKEISDLFRGVFGDDAMPAPGRTDPRIRPLLNWQYDNQNNTALGALTFLDGYFNKTDPSSTYSGSSIPPSAFLFGGGPATYYSSQDRLGIVEELPFNLEQHGGFETPVLKPGEARLAPTDSPWTFTGQAGILRQAERLEATLTSPPAPAANVPDGPFQGVRLTVGPEDVAVYELGIFTGKGFKGDEREVRIHDAADGRLVGSAEVEADFATPGSDFAFARTGRQVFILSKKFFAFPFILKAGRSYDLVAPSPSGRDTPLVATLKPPQGLNFDGPIVGKESGKNILATTLVPDAPGQAYGPVNLRIAASPITSSDGSLVPGHAQDSKQDRAEQMRSNIPSNYSPQALFLAGTGSAEIPVTFAEPGVHGLIYHLAYPRDPSGESGTPGNPPKVYLIDGDKRINITPDSQSDTRPGNWNHEGFWTKPSTGYDFFGSAPFVIEDTSRPYRIRFETDGKSQERLVFIDNVCIASTRAMLAGTIPAGGGLAEGAPDVSNWEARLMRMYTYGQAFGLQATAYEGGWYPGGDANKMPLQFAASFHDPIIRAGETNAIRAIARAGLAVNADYSRDFALPDHDMANHNKYMRVQAWDEMADSIPPEATNGLPVAATLTPSDKWVSHRLGADGRIEAGGWLAWNILVPSTGRYVFSVETAPGDGNFRLVCDDATEILTGGAGTPTGTSSQGVELVAGLHSLRLLAVTGPLEVRRVSGALPGQPFGLSGLTGTAGQGRVKLSWPAVPAASGYHIYYKPRLATVWKRATESPLPASSTSHTVTDLTNEISTQFVVTSLQDGQESGYSNQITLFPSERVPIVSWDFDDAAEKASSPLVPTQSMEGITTSPLQLGPGLTPTKNDIASKDAYDFSGADTPALDPDAYLSWRVSPEEGHSVELRRAGLQLWSASEPPARFELRASSDGFKTHQVVPLSPDPAKKLKKSNFRPASGLRVEGDLTAIPGMNPVPASGLEFRLYAWGVNSPRGTIGLGKGSQNGQADGLWLEGKVTP